MRQSFRQALTIIRPRGGRRRRCSPSRSSVRLYSHQARNSTIATPTMSCSVSSLKNLKGSPLAKVFQDRLFGPLGMKHTLLPANTSNAIPEPYSHGYLYGSSSYALVDALYSPDLQRSEARRVANACI